MSLLTSMLALADGVAHRSGLLRRPLRGEALVTTARRRSGLSEFRDADFLDPVLDPLRRLLSACQEEADLSLVGRIATRWDVVRFLGNLLRLHQEEQRTPGILEQKIERPIFITGLPRSGTTFLHRLLLEDPENRGPRVWQTIEPYPPARSRDDRIRRVTRQLRAFERLAPEFRALHPLEANSPQECSEITAHAFRSLRFDTTYRIPSYRSWLDQAGHLPAYQLHRRFLQHLQHQVPGGRAEGRWVLKCPDHLFALDTLRVVYPDARLVFVHRDPVKVLLSVAKLTEVLRQPFTRKLDPHEIGRQESARWLEGTRRMVAVGDDAGLPEPVHHVHYTALTADPVGTVAGLYRHFGLPLAPSVAGSIARFARALPNGGYGPRNYRFEDHGLNADAERQKFRSYVERFGIE